MSSLSPPRSRHLGWTLALLAFAQLITSLDFNIVFVALPRIGEDLGFSDHTLQWVTSAYAVTYGGFLLLGGRAADLLGRRRLFVLALLVYALSSLVGGLAESSGLLVAARAVQGLGGALLFPATLSLVNTLFAEGPERNRALAIWSGAGASGLCLGSLLGGLLTEAFGWESVFYVNVPLAGGAALLAFTLIPADGMRQRGRSFDLPGAVTVTAGVTLLAFALIQGPESGWTSPIILASFALAAVLLAGFLTIEARSRDPLMPLRLMANRSLSGSMAVTLIFGATFNALPYFLTLYFQTVHGYSALMTGAAFLVPSLMIAAGTQVGERMATRAGMRLTLLTGIVTGAAGTALLAAGMTTGGSYWSVLPGIVVLGLGQGLTWTGMWIAAASGVAPEEQGVASGMASTALQVGTALGLAVLIAIATGDVAGLTGEALRGEVAGGLRAAVFVAAAGILLSALIALTFKRRRAEAERVHADA
ncbi:MFS transporter [Streptosporangium lutulentum]|uniref:EmrB/QacA subfamily drug resistance transporter n=1 Tax=Streptosporangium lutulentum TaxID=1461250 RepID=A0ABT9QP94_9ACTN|nr:MFS transporter [Streptosporangium lutulentum]MDP9848588.1 EmrB/QacA subfamily drug resistance transporter [Streptosporangium lutulentum]